MFLSARSNPTPTAGVETRVVLASFILSAKHSRLVYSGLCELLWLTLVARRIVFKETFFKGKLYIFPTSFILFGILSPYPPSVASSEVDGFIFTKNATLAWFAKLVCVWYCFCNYMYIGTSPQSVSFFTILERIWPFSPANAKCLSIYFKV